MDILQEHNIVKYILNGETAKFELLINKYKKPAFNMLLRMVKDYDLANDLLQDSFIKSYQNLNKFNFNSNFGTWFYRITYNIVIDHLRKKKKEFPVSLLIEEPELNENLFPFEGKNFNNFDQNEIIKYLNNIINELNEFDSFLITSFYINDLSLAEIEEITGVSKTNLKVKLFRLRIKMNEELKKKLGAEYELWR